MPSIEVVSIAAEIVNEAGHDEALRGMSYSHGLYQRFQDGEIIYAVWKEKAEERALKLAHQQGGHNKYLESIILWIDVVAPRYWWQQADTYRLSTKQSASSMHTILTRHLTQRDFADPIPEPWLEELNRLIDAKDWERVKQYLPESFLQRRMWCMSYKTLQNIYNQRKNHKLKEWHKFLDSVVDQLEYPEYIVLDWKEPENG